MPVESKKKPAPQPDEAIYGPELLRIYDTYTRDSYRVKFGERAPAWDKNRRIKRWFDTDLLAASANPDADTVTYNFFVFGSRPRIETMTMTVREASTPNLPGDESYPKYVPQPTDARMVDGVGNVVGSVRGEFYTNRQEAEMLLAELQALTPKATGIQISPDFTSGAFQIRYGNDGRRPWEIVYEGSQYGLNVGSHQIMKYSSGIGAPGHWDVSQAAPIWVTEAVPAGHTFDQRPEIDIPIRALLPNEKIAVLMLGMQTSIIRTDKDSPANPLPKPGEGGVATLDPAIAQAINRIDSNVKYLIASELGLTTANKPQL